MGLWDNVKDWFTKYDMEEEKKKYAGETEKLNEALSAKEREAIKRRQEALEKEIANALPELPEIEIKPLPEFDEEEVKSSVKDKLDDEYKESFSELDKNYGSKIDNKVDAVNEYADKLNKKAAEYKNDTEESKEDFKNRAIKNGIIKSSIVSSKGDELNEVFNAKAGELKNDYEAKNQAITKEINALEEEKNSKAAKLDSNYQTKIQSEIDKLTKEFEKNKAEIEKQNLNAEKALAAAKAEQAKLKNELIAKKDSDYEKLLEEEKTFGIKDEERKKDYDERLRIAKDFYSQFPPKVAKELAYSNDKLYNLLGANYRYFREFLNELG